MAPSTPWLLKFLAQGQREEVCACGWIVGVVAGTAALLYGVNHAIDSLHRKSLETKIPQRRFPGRRK